MQLFVLQIKWSQVYPLDANTFGNGKTGCRSSSSGKKANQTEPNPTKTKSKPNQIEAGANDGVFCQSKNSKSICK